MTKPQTTWPTAPKESEIPSLYLQYVQQEIMWEQAYKIFPVLYHLCWIRNTLTVTTQVAWVPHVGPLVWGELDDLRGQKCFSWKFLGAHWVFFLWDSTLHTEQSSWRVIDKALHRTASETCLNVPEQFLLQKFFPLEKYGSLQTSLPTDRPWRQQCRESPVKISN